MKPNRIKTTTEINTEAIYKEYRSNPAWNFNEDDFQSGLLVLVSKYNLEELSVKEALKLAYTCCYYQRKSANFKASKVLEYESREPNLYDKALHEDPLTEQEIERQKKEDEEYIRLIDDIRIDMNKTCSTIFHLYLSTEMNTKDIAAELGMNYSYLKRRLSATKKYVADKYNVKLEDVNNSIREIKFSNKVARRKQKFKLIPVDRLVK